MCSLSATLRFAAGVVRFAEYVVQLPNVCVYRRRCEVCGGMRFAEYVVQLQNVVQFIDGVAKFAGGVVRFVEYVVLIPYPLSNGSVSVEWRSVAK